MLAKTVKNNVHLHARFIGQYWAIYPPIFQISAFFAANDMANDFPISYRQQTKKERYRAISRPTRPIFKTGNENESLSAREHDECYN